MNEKKIMAQSSAGIGKANVHDPIYSTLPTSNTENATIAMSPNAKRNSHRKISKSAVKDKRYPRSSERNNNFESDQRLV